MKIFRILLVIAALQISFCLSAQKLKTDDVPGDVTQSFSSEYPSAKISSWELKDNMYVAQFKDDGSNGKAVFKNDGTWVETTYDIPTSEIPLSIAQYVNSNYPNYEISVCNLREMPKTATHYYLEVRFPEVGSKDLPSVLTFDYVGNLIKRQDPEGWKLRTDEPVRPTTSTTKPSKPAKVEVVSNEQQAKTKDDVKAENAKAEREEKAEKAQKADKGKKGKNEAAAPHDPWAQYAIKQSEVPDVAKKMLKKKAPKATDQKWFLVAETYVCKCMERDLEKDVYISKSGVWKKTYAYMLEEKVSSAITNHLATYYKGYKFSKAFTETRADKKNKLYIEFYEKKNWKKKIPTGAWFDGKTRKFIRTVDPNFEDPFNDPDVFTEVAPSAEDLAASIAELPEGIKSYVSSNYPSHKIRDYEMEEDKDLGQIYKVDIASTGNSYIILYFDKSGKFLRKELSSGMKTVKSYGDYDEVDVPEVVLNAFAAKFPRVNDAKWDEDENENFDVQFTGTKGKEMCIFSPDGRLLQDLYYLDVDKLIPAIESYIKDNYGKSEIQQYYSVKKDGKNFYKTVILPNKEKYPVYLWFTATGEFDHVEQ